MKSFRKMIVVMLASVMIVQGAGSAFAGGSSDNYYRQEEQSIWSKICDTAVATGVGIFVAAALTPVLGAAGAAVGTGAAAVLKGIFGSN